MSANETQVGGDHYRTSYQHWDLAVKIPMGYLDGCVTKYVTRSHKKHGVQDLQKALHYLDKLLEGGNYDIKRYPNISADLEVKRFADANDLTFLEYQFVFLMCTYDREKTLRNARRILQIIINQAKKQTVSEEITVPGSPEDGGQHAER